MRIIFSKKILAVVISAILFPQNVIAASTIDGDTVTWDGTNIPVLNDALLETSGSNGIQNMVVKNYNLVDFQNGNTFKKMWVPGAISLGGGNGKENYPESYQPYGDLHLTVLDSNIKGAISDQWFWTGLYLRSDSEGASVIAHSNSTIDLAITRQPNEWIQGAAIYAEHKGENGHSEVVLSEGSDITVNLQAEGVSGDYNSAVLAYADKGATVVTAEKNTLITTEGTGVSGIKTYSRDGSTITHAGTIVSHSDIGNGISAHAADDSRGVIAISNLADGVITMGGNNASGIKAYSAGSGDISIFNAGQITLEQGMDASIGQNESSGIAMQSYAGAGIVAENITMTAINEGMITAKGDGSLGIHSESNMDSGQVNIVNRGTIAMSGSDSAGIKAVAYQRDDVTGSAQMQVVNSGKILLGADAADSTAIIANNYESLGNVTVENAGELSVSGSNSGAVSVFAGQKANVINSGNITTADGTAIRAQSSSGETIVVNSGDIAVSSAGAGAFGINAISDYGTAAVRYAGGTLKATGDNSIGIVVNGQSGQQIQVDANTHVDASSGLGGLLMEGIGSGNIDIAEGATVTGGSRQGYGVKFSAAQAPQASTQLTLNNAGKIGALSDLAVAIDDTNGNRVELNNYGDITGYLSAFNSDTALNNYGTMNLRSFADTDGDGVRDTKQVALVQFGAGENQVNNASGALIQLASVQNAAAVDTTGMYRAQGTQSINTAGINQAQMLNVNTFNHAGTLDLTVNQLAGDLLAITGNSTLSGQSIHEGGTVTSGDGNYIANGGSLLLDTVLNAGGKSSQSDVLVVDNAQLGSGATRIWINNLGGQGALTSQDGILVVDVLGESEQNAFSLAGGPLKTGVYEYTLERGSLLNPQNQSFYLRTSAQQINPDVGSYLANQAMATGLFMHSLHDRLGEPQYLERFKGDERGDTGMWMRAVASNTKSDAAGRALSVDSNSRVVHLGGDVTQWDTENGDRYHLGLMGAWGRSDSVSRSKATGSSARSHVDGYGVGAYLTWYNQAEQREGWYSDLWGMYNWFTNSAESAKDYNSRSWIASLETGYASTLKGFDKWRWMVEPQGQVSYTHYTTSTIKDQNSLSIGNDDASGIATRLGLRTYLQPTVADEKAQFQPFLTVNWLWSDASNSMAFNNTTFSSDVPKNRFEAKLGLQTEVRKNVHLYGQISGQVGENNYTHKAAQFGLRYQF